MLYEMCTATLTYRGAAEFEQEYPRFAEERTAKARLIAFFHCEIGDINRVMHIWAYENAAHREEVLGDAIERPWWPPATDRLIVEQSSKLLRAMPFFPEPRTGTLGNVYEVRTYTIKPGKMRDVIACWTKSAPGRDKLSPIAAWFLTESGPLNQAIHIWPYKDLNERAAVREAQYRDLPPTGTAPFIAHQHVEIWLPAAFSPMH